MTKKNQALLTESKIAMSECSKLLNEISTTCCMKERSPNMVEALSKIEDTLNNIEAAHTNDECIHNAISDIGSFGRMVGYLNATCCTETREPLYQKMFKEMNVAHTKLWQFMGHSH